VARVRHRSIGTRSLAVNDDFSLGRSTSVKQAVERPAEERQSVKSRPPQTRMRLLAMFIVAFLLRVADAVELKTAGQARGARVR
jgi:hypothetical protein